MHFTGGACHVETTHQPVCHAELLWRVVQLAMQLVMHQAQLAVCGVPCKLMLRKIQLLGGWGWAWPGVAGSATQCVCFHAPALGMEQTLRSLRPYEPPPRPAAGGQQEVIYQSSDKQFREDCSVGCLHHQNESTITHTKTHAHQLTHTHALTQSHTHTHPVGLTLQQCHPLCQVLWHSCSLDIILQGGVRCRVGERWGALQGGGVESGGVR